MSFEVVAAPRYHHSEPWIAEARRLCGEVLRAFNQFVKATHKDDLREGALEAFKTGNGMKPNRSFMVTQIVARALDKRGYPDVTVGERFFQPRGSDQKLPRSLLLKDGLFVDVVSANESYACSDDEKDCERPDRADKYYAGWNEPASRNQKGALNDKIDDVMEENVFRVLSKMPFQKYQEDEFIRKVREIIAHGQFVEFVSR